MDELLDLYREVIVDHNRSPRNFGKLADADRVLEGYNPVCGDHLTLYLRVGEGRVNDIRFDGSGCAISVASASIMTDMVKGKRIAEAQEIFDQFHGLVSGREPVGDSLGKLSALAGVRAYPSRVKCATLCWHTLRSVLAEDSNMVTTE